MKKLLTTIVCCMFVAINYAQITLETASVRIDDRSYPVITPTLNNLVSIVNMDVPTFKATMAKYRYNPDTNNTGPSYLYTNMSIDFFLDDNNGRGVNDIMFDPNAGNNKFAGFRILNQCVYPNNCVQDLYTELAPYYTKTENGTKYYAFTSSGGTYGVCIIPLSNYSGTVIQIYKFK